MATYTKYTNTTLGGNISKGVAGTVRVLKPTVLSTVLHAESGATISVATHALPIYIPAGSLILGAWLHTITSLTGTGATLIVQTHGGSADLVASVTCTDLDADGITIGKPVGSEAAANAPVLVKADTYIEAVVGTHTIDTGDVEVIVEFIPVTLS